MSGLVHRLYFICLGLLFASGALSQGLYWDAKSYPGLPVVDSNGKKSVLTAAFAGTHGEAVILAGGILHRPAGKWIAGEPRREVLVGLKNIIGGIDWFQGETLKMSRPAAYGASASLPEGLLCIDGFQDSAGMTQVRLLQWEAGRKILRETALPAIPRSLTEPVAARLGDRVFVYGLEPDSETSRFYSFPVDPFSLHARWEELPPYPGEYRRGPLMAAQSDGFGKYVYLFGGDGDSDVFGYSGPLETTWRYDPGARSWKEMAPMLVNGRYFVLRNRTALPVGAHHVLFPGVGEQFGEGHPQMEVLAYHTITDTWGVIGSLPPGFSVWGHPIQWGPGIFLVDGFPSVGASGFHAWELTPRSAPRGLRPLDYVVIALYLLILVWMGAHFMRRGRTTEDYFKAGKRIPWWAAGISIFATSLSAITYMAVPAKAFGTDWTFALLNVAQILTAPLVIWLVLPFFRRLNVTTAYEYLERRFHPAVRLIGGLCFLLFQFGRIGIVLFLPAIALSVVTGVDISLCIVVMAVLSIFYTVLGGIEAVIWTDVKQVVVLGLGAVVCLFLLAGGVDGGFSGLVDIAVADDKLRLAHLHFDFQSPTLWVVLGGGIGTNLINQTSDQTFVQRYLTTKTERSAAWSLLTPAFLVLPVTALFFGLGTALYGFYKTHPALLNPTLDNPDAIFPWYIVSQLPEGLSGLLIAGIFAASMSSLDSSLNSAATVITVDFYKRFRPGRTEKNALLVARLSTVIVGLAGMGFALLLAGAEIKSLWDEFSKILGLFAGGLAGIFLLGMSSRRATTGGALIGFGVSAAVQYWVSSTGAVHFLLYTFTGLASSFAVGWLASWMFASRKDLHGLTIGTVREVMEE